MIEFEIVKMKKDASITYYFVRVMIIYNKMRSNGKDMPDNKIVEKFWVPLIEKFTYVVVSIEESKDNNNMSSDELQSSLVVHEQKCQRSNINKEEQVLNVEGRTKITEEEKLTGAEDEEKKDQLSTKQLAWGS